MNVSAEKDKSDESDRIGSLILASLEEAPSNPAKKSPVSSPKDDSQRDKLPKDDLPLLNKWSPDYGFDDDGMTDDDLYSVRNGITGGGSYRFSSLDDTPSGRSNSGVFSPPGFSMPTDSLHFTCTMNYFW